MPAAIQAALVDRDLYRRRRLGTPTRHRDGSSETRAAALERPRLTRKPTTAARSRRTAIEVSVVIPARNEAANIGWVLQRLPSFVDEVVLVDGHSTDDTIAVARRTRPDVVIVRDGSRGKGEAMRTGAAASRGRFIVMLDADGSMDPLEMERFIAPLRDGHGFVKGSRFLSGGGTADMTPLRMLGNAGLNRLSNALFGSRWTDLCYGYCAFRREVLEQLALDADGFEIESQMVVRAARLGIPTKEIASFEYPRRFGASNLNTFRDGWRVLKTILGERFARRRQGGQGQVVPRPSRRLVDRRGRHASGDARSTTARDVDVVVCTHTFERRELLDDLVRSIADGHLAPHELIVVVDGNPALFAELSGAEWPIPVRVIESDGRGLAAARNTGWRAASSRLIAFIDDDGFASPGWLDELAEAIEEHDADVVGGRIEPRWTSDPPAWFSARLGWVVGCTYEGLPTTASVVRNVIGCNMLVRRDLLEALGGFDPEFGRTGPGLTGCEETELCIRATSLGARVVMVPGATVEQVLPPDRATLRHALRRAWHEGRSKRLLVRRHGNVIGIETRYAGLVLRDAVRVAASAIVTGRYSELRRSVGLVGVLTATTVSYLVAARPR